jgi:hypothetical protein
MPELRSNRWFKLGHRALTDEAIMREGDRLISEISLHLSMFNPQEDRFSHVDVTNLKEAAIELGRLLAWASELLSTRTLLGHQERLESELARMKAHEDHPIGEVRDRRLEGSLKGFGERVRNLSNCLEELSWD